MGRVGFSKKLKSDPESWNSLERHSTEKPISKIIKCGLENQQKKKKDFLRRFSIDRSCFSFKKENVNNFDSFYNIFIYKNIYFPFMMQFLSRVSKSLPQVLKNF